MAVSKHRKVAGGTALLLCASGFAETPSVPETGKKVFVERCASCHNERGDKALSTGAPLSDRSLSDEQLARAVAGRLKGSADAEKRAVAQYIRSFQRK